jgi:hypothetical protein
MIDAIPPAGLLVMLITHKSRFAAVPDAEKYLDRVK